MSVNKVILIGNVGSDPKMQYADKDTVFARLSLATNERIGTVDRTEWHNLVMAGRLAEQAERFIRKGTRLYAEGRLRTRTYNDKFNIVHYITEIYVDNFEILGRSN